MARRRRRDRRNPVVGILLFLCMVSILIYATYLIKTTVEPNLEQIGKIRSQAMITRMVNKAVAQQFSQEMKPADLLVIDKNQDGDIEMVQANTKTMNLLKTGISQKLQGQFREIQEEEYKVPVGSLIGSEIFSQTGPKVTLKVLPLTVSMMDFKTEFESQGINQTKYKVYIIQKSKIKILAPFSSSTFSVSSSILVAETVILGKVPTNYVQVPHDEILDGLNVD